MRAQVQVLLPNVAQAARVQETNPALAEADITIPKAASQVEQFQAAATPSPERELLQETVLPNKKAAAIGKIVVE